MTDVFSGLLPTSAEDTAEFLQQLNSTFDVLNSSSPRNPDPMKRALMDTNIVARRKFLEDVTAWLERWSVQVRVFFSLYLVFVVD